MTVFIKISVLVSIMSESRDLIKCMSYELFDFVGILGQEEEEDFFLLQRKEDIDSSNDIYDQSSLFLSPIGLTIKLNSLYHFAYFFLIWNLFKLFAMIFKVEIY
jgi:hypothetical protein